MRISSLFTYTMGVALAAAVIAGCSNGGSAAFGLPATGTSGRGAMKPPSLAVMPLTSVRPDHGKSWIDRKEMQTAKGTLWISDAGTDDVHMYALPKLKPTGTITGFNEPQGMCTDNKNDVWIVNTGGENVLEYSPEGEQIRSLSDDYGYPVGCAVSRTGDLAVTDYSGFESSGSGQVLLYKKASGTPIELSNPNQYYYYFPTFDSNGDLYVDGLNASGEFSLSGCVKDATSCGTIQLSGGTINFPGGVLYIPSPPPASPSVPCGFPSTGPCLVVVDQNCDDSETSCAYEVSVSLSGSSGIIEKSIEIKGYSGDSVCDVVQGVVTSNETLLGGGDYEYCGYSSSAAYTWKFAAGGLPTAYEEGLDEPVGAAYVK